MTNPRPVAWSVRLYKQLLRAYPRDFRKQFAIEMELVFENLASEAWQRDHLRGLLCLWVRILADWLRSLPVEHYRDIKGTYAMNRLAATGSGISIVPDPTPMRIAGRAILAVVTSYLLYLTFGAVLHISMLGASLLWRDAADYQKWPPSGVILFLLPSLLTGLVACRVQGMYRPHWTAPIGPVATVLVFSVGSAGTPWYGVLASVALTAAATLLGSVISEKIARASATACPA
ncbi:MAG: hypothetical protein SGJ20_18515 [Planctomycetota bacterium]|nr:hypothetical protein [Planctomycetota bacterium]